MAKLIRFHRFDGNEVLQADELDAGEALVAVQAAGVNPVDFKICSGKYLALKKYPAVKNDRVPYALARLRMVCPKPREVGRSFGMVGAWVSGYSERLLDEDAISAKPTALDHVMRRPHFPWLDNRHGWNTSGMDT